MPHEDTEDNFLERASSDTSVCLSAWYVPKTHGNGWKTFEASNVVVIFRAPCARYWYGDEATNRANEIDYDSYFDSVINYYSSFVVGTYYSSFTLALDSYYSSTLLSYYYSNTVWDEATNRTNETASETDVDAPFDNVTESVRACSNYLLACADTAALPF